MITKLEIDTRRDNMIKHKLMMNNEIKAIVKQARNTSLTKGRVYYEIVKTRAIDNIKFIRKLILKHKSLFYELEQYYINQDVNS